MQEKYLDCKEKAALGNFRSGMSARKY